MIKNLLLILLLILFCACNSKFSLQKRRYIKGFYFSSMFLKKDLKRNERYSIQENTRNETTKFTESILSTDPIHYANKFEKQAMIANSFSSLVFETKGFNKSVQTKVGLNKQRNIYKLGLGVQRNNLINHFRRKSSPSLVPFLIISGLILFILLIASLRKDENDSLKKILAILFLVSGAVLFMIATLGGTLSVFFGILSLSLSFLGFIIARRIGFLDF